MPPATTSGLIAAAPELITKRVRSEVARRLRFVNFKHTEHAWDLRHRDPLCPHGLALFFLDVDVNAGEPARYQLRTATRLDPAGDEVADLPRRVHAFSDGVRRYRAEGTPVLDLMNRVEPLSPYALFIGVGVSSLDTPDGTWDTVRGQVENPMHIPGRGYAMLIDNTTLILDRGGRDRIAHLHAVCNAVLDDPADTWTHNPAQPTGSDGVVFQPLSHLIWCLATRRTP